MPDAKPNPLWVLLAGLAVGIGISSLIIPAVIANLPLQWGGDPVRTFLLPGGTAQAQNLTNPYSLQVAPFRGKFAIFPFSMLSSELEDLSTRSPFQVALAAGEQLSVYRDGSHTVVLVGNSTLKEALGFSRLPRIAAEFAKTEPIGFSMIPETEAPGLTITKIFRENMAAIAIGTFFLAVLFTLLKAAFPVRPGEDGEGGPEEG